MILFIDNMDSSLLTSFKLIFPLLLIPSLPHCILDLVYKHNMDQVLYCESSFCPHCLKVICFKNLVKVQLVWNSSSRIMSIFKIVQCCTLILELHKDSHHRVKVSIPANAKLYWLQWGKSKTSPILSESSVKLS